MCRGLPAVCSVFVVSGVVEFLVCEWVALCWALRSVMWSFLCGSGIDVETLWPDVRGVSPQGGAHDLSPNG